MKQSWTPTLATISQLKPLVRFEDVGYERRKMDKENLPLALEPIFTSDQDWHCNACLNWSHDALELYVLGYKEAADRLVIQMRFGAPKSN